MSKSLFSRASRSIPGGVNSPVRAFGAVGGTPFFVDRAKGPYLTDSEGQSLVFADTSLTILQLAGAGGAQASDAMTAAFRAVIFAGLPSVLKIK